MQPIKEIFPLLSQPRKIVITMHQKPDADAMGSGLAMYHFLLQFGHEVQLISPTNWARWLNWMPGVDTVLDYELYKAKSDEALQNIDWLFALILTIWTVRKPFHPLCKLCTVQKF